MNKLIRRRPYGRDNDLNAFGDYQHLEVTSVRKGPGQPISHRNFRLVGELKGKEIVKKLTRAQFNECVYNLFCLSPGTDTTIE